MSSKKRIKTYKGYIDHASPQQAYFVTPLNKEDFVLPWKKMMGAMHGDYVEVLVERKNNRTSRTEARVLKILERKNRYLVGKIGTLHGKKHFLSTAKKIPYAFLIEKAKTKNFSPEEKLYAQITRYPSLKQKGAVQIERILGRVGSYQAETAALMEEFALKEDFPEAVVQELKGIDGGLTDAEIRRREDFRQVPTVTIDPFDAKDFDDAVSFQKLGEDRYQVGVHIADVTHYVKVGSALDKEARRRGNSTYLIGKCVPMLPERLSNDLCSLKPNTDRPAFSVIFELNKKGEVHQYTICETVIHSQKRFTYAEAQQVIETREGPFAEMLTHLQEMTQCMRSRRKEQGAIPFRSNDVEVVLDAEKLPERIQEKPALKTHELIEELALLANRTVAEEAYKTYTKKGQPFLYREHAPPESEKIEMLVTFLKNFNLSFDSSPDQIAYAYQALIDEVSNTPLEHIVQNMAIRTMSQARYSVHKPAHFGLGFNYYTHFTSPIRRYVDLRVHELFKRKLANKPVGSQERIEYEQIALQTSATEQTAKEAERASMNYTQARFMYDKKGSQFDGLIVGITAWGIYVEILPHKCEGMIRVSDISDDYYIFDQDNFVMKGSSTNRLFKIGDLIKVKVKGCNLDKRTIDLSLVT